jgi:two-component sensor histidine kinase
VEPRVERIDIKSKSIVGPVARVVLPYLFLGTAWILFSDRLLLSLVDDPQKLLFVSMAKGWFYVLVTGALLLLLVYREMRKQSILEAMLRKGILEKDALLSELNHRVMNNLQVLTSILNLESENHLGREAVEMNARTRARIRAMGIAQERLYEAKDFGWIDLGAYLRALWEALKEIFAVQQANARFECIAARCGPEDAVPFGLFAAEAISNALRFGGASDGGVNVSIRLMPGDNGALELLIRDGGPGVPDGASGLGLRLMDALAAQLGGTVLRSNESGAQVLLRFPRPGSADA